MFRQEILNSYNALGYDGEVVEADNGETSAQLPSPHHRYQRSYLDIGTIIELTTFKIIL